MTMGYSAQWFGPKPAALKIALTFATLLRHGSLFGTELFRHGNHALTLWPIVSQVILAFVKDLS
jgi:hypothetical protein